MESEADYEDLLQNIEAGILAVYHQHPELTDYEVENALEALYLTYKAEQQANTAVLPRSILSLEVYHNMREKCEFRLGRLNLPGETKPKPVTIEIIHKALKQIRQSIEMRTIEGGRQGYLNTIAPCP
jgi:hypothetical protein